MKKSYKIAWEEQVIAPQKVIGMIEVARAKAQKILYQDQIFIEASAHLYPSEISSQHTFKGKTTARFKAIKPSDEEEMRRLFYRFSDQSVYYRYFAPIKVMHHSKMQEFVNKAIMNVFEKLGFCLGTGHASAFGQSDLKQWLRILGPYLGQLHLHDNLGSQDEHPAMGSGIIDFNMLFKYFKKNGNTPPVVTLEPHSEKDLWPSLEYLAQEWPW